MSEEKNTSPESEVRGPQSEEKEKSKEAGKNNKYGKRLLISTIISLLFALILFPIALKRFVDILIALNVEIPTWTKVVAWIICSDIFRVICFIGLVFVSIVFYRVEKLRKYSKIVSYVFFWAGIFLILLYSLFVIDPLFGSAVDYCLGK